MKEGGRLKDSEGEEIVFVCGNIASEVFRENQPLHDDVVWTNKCILAKIKDGMYLSFIQQSFSDSGFMDYKLISMGGDNVLLYPCVDGDVTELFNLAADLVGNFLYDCRPWTKDSNVQYERGAITCLE